METHDKNTQVARAEFNEFVGFVVKNVATKEDLKQFATKEDLKQFATKEDLKQFATKEDLDEKFNLVMNAHDKVMGELKIIRQEQTMKVGRDDRQDEDIKNLTTRVTGVERRVGIEPIGA